MIYYSLFAPKVNQDQQYTEAEDSHLDTELEELRQRIKDVSLEFGVSMEKVSKTMGIMFRATQPTVLVVRVSWFVSTCMIGPI